MSFNDSDDSDDSDDLDDLDLESKPNKSKHTTKHTSTNKTQIDLSNCKVKYTYLLDENSKPLQIVSNLGLKKYEICYVGRNGEYSGFAVEAQQDIPSILTNHHIEMAIKYIKERTMIRLHILSMSMIII